MALGHVVEGATSCPVWSEVWRRFNACDSVACALRAAPLRHSNCGHPAALTVAGVISKGDQCGWNSQAECLSGLEVDHQGCLGGGL
jgi:hypothetical protein